MNAIDSDQRHGIRSHGTVSGQQQRSGVEVSSATTSATSEQPEAIVTYDQHTRFLAIRALHNSTDGVPADPAEVAAAWTALAEIVAKHRGDLAWSRDTRRAVKRYHFIIDAHGDRLVEVARTKGLLPTTKEH